jgi:prevent-host-death family protein
MSATNPADQLPVRVTATEVGRTPGDLIDRALQGPIAIERRGKVKAVLLSAAEYDRLKGRDPRLTGRLDELPDDLMVALAESIDAALAQPRD